MAMQIQTNEDSNILRDRDPMDCRKYEQIIKKTDDKCQNIMFTEKENLIGKEKRKYPENVCKERENLKNILRSKLEAVVPTAEFPNSICIYKDDESEKIEEDVPITETASNIVHPRNPLQEISLADTLPAVVQSTRERFFEVEEYQRDILMYLKESEPRSRPKYDYMRKQPDINSHMRTVLIDWIVEVCEEYRLNTETLYLSVSYVDRFLSYMSVVRSKLQLVGTAAMFIAAKFEEVYPPDVADFVYITDDTYSKKQVLRMEQLILKVLSFDMSAPTVYGFISLYTAINRIPDKVKFLAMFLSELSLLDADPFLQYLPSHISAAAIALSRYLCGDCMWSKSLEDTTGYNVSQLKKIICQLNTAHFNSLTIKQKAVQDKYKTEKYLEVSQIPAATMNEDAFLKAVENITREREEAVDQENNENVTKMISSLLFD